MGRTAPVRTCGQGRREMVPQLSGISQRNRQCQAVPLHQAPMLVKHRYQQISAYFSCNAANTSSARSSAAFRIELGCFLFSQAVLRPSQILLENVVGWPHAKSRDICSAFTARRARFRPANGSYGVKTVCCRAKTTGTYSKPWMGGIHTPLTVYIDQSQ